MLTSVDFSGRPFHFIGIGGIGMSALAYVIAQRKLPVSGSDIRSSHITERLQAIGAHIFAEQQASNLEFFNASPNSGGNGSKTAKLGESANNGAAYRAVALPESVLPQVVCSTAINPANTEYRAALDLGCPILHRSDLLAALIQDYYSIAVAGTHGKTTTSSMMGYLLLEAGLDPTIVVGGEVTAWGGNARLGKGKYLVAEADESDGSLVKLSSEIGIITNIELDHPDHYENLAEVIDTFQVFATSCKTTIGCIDCTTVKEHLSPAISYSLQPEIGADYTVDCIVYRAEGTTARVWERGEILGQLNLQLLGEHNLSNALAVVALGRYLGLEFPVIAGAIATFTGASRRFEKRGEVNGIRFIDDYAHHPSEINATLAAARIQANGLLDFPQTRVVAVFQPHRYSRTQTFLTEFGQCFKSADLVVVTDIYSAGEPKLAEISGERVAQEIAAHHPQVVYQPSLKAVCRFLTENLQPGDLAIFLGAGNLNQIIPEVVTFYQQTAQGMPQEYRLRA
ncbi:MAG: UDP-N-acetylmuramate--L-alanine ligase [Phormidium sp.]